MLLVVTVITAAAAPLGYIFRGLRGDRLSLIIFIMLSLAAPTLLLTVASLIHQLSRQFGRLAAEHASRPAPRFSPPSSTQPPHPSRKGLTNATNRTGSNSGSRQIDKSGQIGCLVKQAY